MTKKVFRLVHKEARDRASAYCQSAPEGYVVTFSEPTRSLDQSAKFHAICKDFQKSGKLFAGRPRTAIEWKVTLISGHSVATLDQRPEVIPGIEGEYVNIRESTARMSVKRAASLIEYAMAYAALNGISING